MPVPLEQFVKHPEESGIIAGDTLQDFIPPKASPKDAELLRSIKTLEMINKKPVAEFWKEVEEQQKGK